MSMKLARTLADLGASPEVIAVAVEAVTLASRDGDVTRHGAARDTKAAERARRYRKSLKHKRKTEGAKANDVATTVMPASRDATAKRCDLPSTSSLFPEVVTEEGSKKAQKVKTEKGARASRMIAGAVISDIDFQFALDQGAEPAAIRQAWAEFVDYWIGIPGQRGRKLDWPATWRNRVRDVFCKGRKNGHGKQSLSERAFNLAEQARSAERAAGIERPDDPIRGH